MEEFLADLRDWLRIPSVSSDPNAAAEVRRGAEFCAGLLEKAGLDNVRLVEGPGHPLVVGDWLHAEGKPTLLCYGHYDVQPAEPLELWRTPPFEPTLIGGNLYARGAADDKGLAIILIKAVERYLRAGKPLPVNVKFLIEGEEESGGDHVSLYVAEEAASLRCDAALICDTEMFAPELPTICVGLRGIVYGELIVRTGDTDLHSGVYGGTVANAVEAAARILARLKDEQGRIAIDGFDADVEPPSAEEQASWRRLPFDEENFRGAEAKVFALVGDPNQSLFARIWARPALEVHGIGGGFTGQGAKTVIPCEAVVKLSARLAAGQDPARAARLLAGAIAAAAPLGARSEFRVLHMAAASVIDPRNALVREAAAAMQEVFGVATVFTRSGGSIPIVGLFQKHLGVGAVLCGFGLPDDNLHAPNEKVYLPNVARGIEAIARYFERLGAL